MIAKALENLKKYFGYTSFRESQTEIIESILNGKSTVGIMPTGGGKSICYQIPALLFDGITIVISPLISLMKDQVDALNNSGIPAVYINSSLTAKEFRTNLAAIANDRYKLVYIAPERLETESFINIMTEKTVSMVVIDEAHCISHWGHDFRKSYLDIPRFVKKLSDKVIVSAFTATATIEVRDDIIDKLKMKKPNVIVKGFDRENLTYKVIKGEKKEDYIYEYIKKNSDKSGIIYAATRKEVDSIYEKLSKKKIPAGKYHAGMSDNDREKMQEKFIYDEIGIMVATNAFGMGIDKSNVRYVIHHNMPKDMESYYQEAGRAGRDGNPSECILLYGPRDVMVQKFLIEKNEFNASEAIIENKFKKLQSMVDYCHTSRCLREYILKYFGEEDLPENCANCSNCMDTEKKDITTEAKKIISCIGRTKERYGITKIADILTGSKNKDILAWGLDKLTTYGIMEGHTGKEAKELISLLIGDGYIEATTGEYPVLKLTQKAFEFIRDEDAKIYRKIIKIERKTEDNEGLFSELRELRTEIARREGVPPYIIFSDKTLLEMAKKMPLDKEEMLRVNGVGEVKYNRYGENFVERIKEYTEQGGAGFPEQNSKIPDGKKSTASKPKQAGKSKIPSGKITYDMYKSGLNIDEITEERQISYNTAVTHLLECAAQGMEYDFDGLIDMETENKIMAVIKKTGAEKLRDIKEKLPEEIDYIQIKAVIIKNKL